MTRKEAACILGCSHQTVSNYISAGKLSAQLTDEEVRRLNAEPKGPRWGVKQPRTKHTEPAGSTIGTGDVA